MECVRKSKGEEWKEYMVWGFAFVFIVLLAAVGICIYGAWKPVVNESGSEEELVFSKDNYAPSFARKLLTSNSTLEDYGGDGQGGDGGDDSSGGDGGDDGSPNRIGFGSGAPCSKESILLFQGPTTPLPNGIPTYTVEIENVCVSESCSIAGIHVSCGWFSSARLIDPSVFRRVSYDDCLVKNGQPLNPGESLSFQYANTFKYPMSVSSVAC